MNIVLRLAWRNLWRQPRRTWLTTGAMVFSNTLLVFMISLQFGMYDLMIDNTLQVFTGHMQVQAPGYKDDQKMRQTVPDVVPLATTLRDRFGLDSVAARGWAFGLASSEERAEAARIEAAEARVRAEEERHVRRLTLQRAAIIVFALFLIGAFALWTEHGKSGRRQRTEQSVSAALNEASFYRGASRFFDALKPPSA